MKFKTDHGIRVIWGNKRETCSYYVTLAEKTFCISIEELEACNNKDPSNRITEVEGPTKPDECKAIPDLLKD